jgi:hypothetical protein
MGSGCIAQPFLTSALDEGEWSASRPGRFTPRESAPCTHWIEGWVGPRVGLDAMEKRKFCHARNGTQVAQPVARRYTDWVIPTPLSLSLSLYIYIYIYTHTHTHTRGYTRSDNKVRELATVFLPWQQWIEISVWFDHVGILSLLLGSTEKV